VNISSPAPTRLRWSLKTQFWAAVIVAILSSACVLLISKKNIWIELEIIVSVLFLIALAYFFFLFYRKPLQNAPRLAAWDECMPCPEGYKGDRESPLSAKALA